MWNKAILRLALLSSTGVFTGACATENGSSLTAQERVGGEDQEVVSRRVLDRSSLRVPGMGGRPSTRNLLPGNQSVVITRYTGEDSTQAANLAVLDLSTNEVRPITNHLPARRPYVAVQRVSRDGRWIAFERGRSGSCCDLMIIRSDGSSERTLLSMGDSLGVRWVDVQDFSPDADALLALVWTADETVQLVRYSLANGASTILRAFGWQEPTRAAFSPDGRFVAYDLSTDSESPARQLFLLSQDGEREVQLTKGPETKLLIGWGEDGSSLYYATLTDGATSSVWRLPMDGSRPAGSPARIRDNLVNAFAWTMVGGRLAYEVDTSRWRELWTAAVDLGAGRFLTEPTLAVRDLPAAYSTFLWTPDRQTLVYTAALNPYSPIGQQLVLHTPSTGDRQIVDLPLTYVSASRWLDERTWIGRGEAQGRTEYVLVDLTTGKASRLKDPAMLRELEDYEGQDWPAFANRVDRIQSVDGSVLYRRRFNARGLQIVAVDVASGAERVIAEVPGLDPNRTGNPRPSPDGRHIAFTSGGSLYHVPAGGGAARILIEGAGVGGVGWAADSRTVLTNSSGNPSRVWKVELETGVAQVALTVPGGPSSVIFNHDWTRMSINRPSQTPPINELWVIENLPETRPAGRSPSPR